MDTHILELMAARHSVRTFTAQSIETTKREILNDLVLHINKKSGLHCQILYDEPSCFDSAMARYGKLSGVANYIALVGGKSRHLHEEAGYHGEHLVLKAQELGLNTCWVALTHGKSKAIVEKDEKQVCLIALGYGITQGVPHTNRPLSELCNCTEACPEWFTAGMNGVLLAPTAMNQQKFYFELTETGKVRASAKPGFYAKLDLGIVKYHFEAVTGVKVL